MLLLRKALSTVLLFALLIVSVPLLFASAVLAISAKILRAGAQVVTDVLTLCVNGLQDLGGWKRIL